MQNNNFFLNAYKKRSNSNEKESLVNDNTNGIEKENQKTVKKAVFEKLERIDTPPQETPIPKKRLAAIFLLLIGLDKAKDIIKSFSEEELIKIVSEIMNIESISDAEIKEVEKNFGKINEKSSNHKGGKEFVRNLLQNSFGITKGSEFFVKVIEKGDDNSFDFLNEFGDDKIKEIIEDESDTIIALILGMLEPKKSANLLSILPKDKSINVIKKMSSKIEINTDVLNIIIKKIKERANEIKSNDKDTVKISGKNKLIEILKNSTNSQSEIILSALEESEPELADELKENIFTFNDIINIPKKDFEKALKDYADKEIAFILKGAKDEIKTIFFTCITKRR
ncbi:MAG TPA: FliG C-terminal domain-containing protein, partial [Spirochaetota bacterium]|nr:FliG C-terminal domain-containing protein [Spirochaetota bacterium]